VPSLRGGDIFQYIGPCLQLLINGWQEYIFRLCKNPQISLVNSPNYRTVIVNPTTETRKNYWDCDNRHDPIAAVLTVLSSVFSGFSTVQHYSTNSIYSHFCKLVTDQRKSAKRTPRNLYHPQKRTFPLVRKFTDLRAVEMRV
jgi:hypothetical protein